MERQYFTGSGKWKSAREKGSVHVRAGRDVGRLLIFGVHAAVLALVSVVRPGVGRRPRKSDFSGHSGCRFDVFQVENYPLLRLSPEELIRRTRQLAKLSAT
ncbi:hypothetical protein GWI33_007713 [Rhynchophorus ferrugineus]|uniref:Uncharacterized protein n=1 Tax=Rhynchophorus ferrugineus TaxID=354439 RepID=A0A834IHD4_RHYFE|nr:hypothetical protein GWI33_007713 [Rhynchophorus ferrugineus]